MARRRYKAKATQATTPVAEVNIAAATPVVQTPAVESGVIAPSSAPKAEAEGNLLLQHVATLQAAEQAARQAQAQVAQARAAVPWKHQVAAIPGLSDHKRRFLRGHPELADPALAHAFNQHYERARAAGIPDDTERMDQHMADALCAEAERNRIAQAVVAAATRTPAPPAPEHRGPPISAPPSRDAPSYGGKSMERGRVTLTPSEREAARMCGISDTDYARNKVRLMEEKARGRYLEPS